MDVREKLVELLGVITCSNTICNFFEHFQNKSACERHKKEAIADHRIANGVTVQEWVSVDDRLPDETGRYLAVKKRIAPDKLGGNRTDIVILRFFVDDGFRMPTHIPDWINKEINEEVTHWMPLPEPPKGE